MEKSIIIVGSGISGLSAGCYARMNGYSAEIFEMHNIPGGLCTAWERKGYKFDISMHMLTGSVSGPFHQMWEELGVIKKFRFHFHERVSMIDGKEKKLSLSVNRKKLEEDMMALSPDDSKLIKELTSVIFGPDIMKAASLKPAKLTTLPDKLKLLRAVLPLLKYFIRYRNVSIQQFAARFKDPFLREAVRFMVDAPGWPMPDFPILALQGYIRNGVSEAGSPLGGSQQVVFHIAGLFRKLGGIINFNTRVADLIIENDRVVGIKLENGTEKRADHVIWAADGHTLMFDILKGNYLSEGIRKMYENWMPVKPIIHVMIGVNRDFSDEPHHIILELDEPITIGKRQYTWLPVINHCFDKSMAPEGKSALEVWFDTEYEYWDLLASDKKEYKAEKKRIADETIKQLDKRWPGFKSQTEVIDVPTPVTYYRYTGNWQGSPDGWYLTSANLKQMKPILDIPGLEGLHLAGQWTSPFTGTVIAALTGRQNIQLICKNEGKKFISSIEENQPDKVKPTSAVAG